MRCSREQIGRPSASRSPACGELVNPDSGMCPSSLGVTWQRRLVRVDSERIWIGHPESHLVLDCIPVNQIGRVTTKSKTGLEKNCVHRMETQLGVDLDADGLFRYALRPNAGAKFAMSLSRLSQHDS